jgi:SAM-dependent methyltransferase
MDDATRGAVCGPKGSLTSDYWQARYDEGTTGWDRGGSSPALLTWLRTGALRPCRILVPGCGRGHEVLALAEAGFEVTGIDYAPAAVQAVRDALAAHGLSATIQQADLFDYQPERPFDAIYEQTCLCALTPARWGCYEKRLAKWLAPGGQLFAAFMQTASETGPPFACRPEAMRELFAAERWEWPATLEPVGHPLGLTELCGILCRRVEADASLAVARA